MSIHNINIPNFFTYPFETKGYSFVGRRKTVIPFNTNSSRLVLVLAELVFNGRKLWSDWSQKNFGRFELNWSLMKENFGRFKLDWSVIKGNFGQFEPDWSLMKRNFSRFKPDWSLWKETLIGSNRSGPKLWKPWPFRIRLVQEILADSNWIGPLWKEILTGSNRIGPYKKKLWSIRTGLVPYKRKLWPIRAGLVPYGRNLSPKF